MSTSLQATAPSAGSVARVARAPARKLSPAPRRLAHLLVLVAALLATLASATKHADMPNPPSPSLPNDGGFPDVDDGKLTPAELSNIVGWISIACWVVVYSPQIYENYQCKTGEGLSLTFVIIWLLGDAMNMIGAIRQGLLLTMIILAGYYCLCDFVLIYQYYYYRRYHDFYHPEAIPHHHHVSVAANGHNERTPLLGGPGSGPGATSNGRSHASRGSQARSSSRTSAHSLPPVVPPKVRRKKPSVKVEVLRYVAALAMIALVGVLAWYISKRSHNHAPPSPSPEPLPGTPTPGGPHHGHRHRKPSDGEEEGGNPIRFDAQVFGWCSAVLYLTSRIPQIFKNRHTKCEGLSLALFLFAVGGNSTYVASILLRSTEREYLLENMSWLVGSVGTIFLDFVVLGQFVAYRSEREELRELAESGELYCDEY